MTKPGPSAARVDGPGQADEVTKMVLDAMEAERFLILFAPDRARVRDTARSPTRDRWISGMQQFEEQGLLLRPAKRSGRRRTALINTLPLRERA